MELIRKGKVKEVYDVGGGELEFFFTNNISVFDKIIPTLVPRKGETLNKASAFWFEKIEKELGVRTHFLKRVDDQRMRVTRIEVDEDYAALTPERTSVMVPLEVVCRHYAAGSLMDRLQDGSVKPSRVGLDAVPEYGAELPEPFVEFTTKLEKVDRPLSDDEARRMSGLTDAEFDHLKDVVLDIDAVIADAVDKRGLIHVDGKKEFAVDADRELMVIDTFGTADEDRWWDRDAYEEGEIRELSKEFVRQHYRDTGYHKVLYEARATGEPEPSIPPLPDEVTREVTDLYVDLYERITGQQL